MIEAPPAARLTEALDRTAEELLRCRDIVLRIEAAVHDLVDGGTPLDAAARADLQAIDLLDQRLADLATWVQALGAASGDASLSVPLAPLLRDLRLADLRDALAGQTDAGPAAERPLPRAADAAHGAAELF